MKIHHVDWDRWQCVRRPSQRIEPLVFGGLPVGQFGVPVELLGGVHNEDHRPVCTMGDCQTVPSIDLDDSYEFKLASGGGGCRTPVIFKIPFVKHNLGYYLYIWSFGCVGLQLCTCMNVCIFLMSAWFIVCVLFPDRLCSSPPDPWMGKTPDLSLIGQI